VTLAGFKTPKFQMPTAAPKAQPAAPAFGASKPAPTHSAASPKGPDALSSFKAQLQGGQVQPNLNKPTLPETAVKTQKFGGWVG
jgi:hypothetical protein